MELQLRGRRPLGQLHLGATNAIGFAFGSLHLWCPPAFESRHTVTMPNTFRSEYCLV